ncbi:SDR family oxidoreductase [Naasia sp. SYSU D00948]|uniref:SDR family oxidoreductase n=1 Tax=Naasia sp. SYSU D00948 TaxID=2817379 RepID=UPI001B310BE8|nr:SDR family oxidoreductase [Naasia sp. SYSU D00948]
MTDTVARTADLGGVPLTALFLGGTGTISTACTRAAVEAGFEVVHLNRSQTDKRPVPEGVTSLTGDVRDRASLEAALGDRTFDVVVDFIAFTPEHVQADIDVFSGRARQYVFISSASAYQTPPSRLPVTESTPLRNPFWEYSRQKAACEDLLVAAYRRDGFPVTIVRPSHTYDETSIPLLGGWTTIDRMRRGLEVVVHGDGSSLWTLTHVDDFARAFTGLLGRTDVLGEAFHITSDEAPAWDAVYRALARAAGVGDPRLVHVPSDAIAALDPAWGASLLGDKTHSMVFDNSKVKAAVPGWRARIPFEHGARQIVAWYDADEGRRLVDGETDRKFDLLVDAYRPRPL